MAKVRFKNLEAELRRSLMTKAEVAKLLGLNVGTISGRFSGASSWRLSEMIKIRSELCLRQSKFEPSDLGLDYLFEKEEQ